MAIANKLAGIQGMPVIDAGDARAIAEAILRLIGSCSKPQKDLEKWPAQKVAEHKLRQKSV